MTPKAAILITTSLALITAGLVRIDGILISLGAAGILLILGAFLLGRSNLLRHFIFIQNTTFMEFLGCLHGVP